jgi:hypothetical protein
MEHPVLGTLQWKSGISPFFNYYLFLRVNGVPILSWKEGQRVPNWATTPEWIAPAATRLTEYDRHQVERWLSAN